MLILLYWWKNRCPCNIMTLLLFGGLPTAVVIKGADVILKLICELGQERVLKDHSSIVRVILLRKSTWRMTQELFCYYLIRISFQAEYLFFYLSSQRLFVICMFIDKLILISTSDGELSLSSTLLPFEFFVDIPKNPLFLNRSFYFIKSLN